MKKAAYFLMLGLLLTGCSLPLTRQIQDRHQAGQWLARAEKMVQAGHYQDAEDAYRRLLEEHPTYPAADQALFSLARLHTLPENPNRDYHQAYQDFDRLLKEFPDSRWAAEARGWRELLATLQAEREEVVDARRGMERLRQEVERIRKDLELERRRYREEVAHSRREAERARRDAERLQQDLQRLRAMEVELERHPRR